MRSPLSACRTTNTAPAEIVDLGEIGVLDRVPDGKRIQPQHIGEGADFFDLVGRCRDIDPHPAGCGRRRRWLHGFGALTRAELKCSNQH